MRGSAPRCQTGPAVPLRRSASAERRRPWLALAATGAPPVEAVGAEAGGEVAAAIAAALAAREGDRPATRIATPTTATPTTAAAIATSRGLRILPAVERGTTSAAGGGRRIDWLRGRRFPSPFVGHGADLSVD